MSNIDYVHFLKMHRAVFVQTSATNEKAELSVAGETFVFAS